MASLISRRLSYRLFASSRLSSLSSPSRLPNTVAKPSFQASATTAPANTSNKPRILEPSFLRSAPFATVRGQSESPDNNSSKNPSSFVRDLMEKERVPIAMWRAHSNVEKQEFVLFLKCQFGDAGTEKPSGFVSIQDLVIGMAGLSMMQWVLGALFSQINLNISILTAAASAVNVGMTLELRRFLQKTNPLDMEVEGDLSLILAEAQSTARKTRVGFILSHLICLGALIRTDRILFPNENFPFMSGLPVFMLVILLKKKSEISELLLSKSHLPMNWTKKQEVWRMVVNYVLHIKLTIWGLVGLSMLLSLYHLVFALYSKVRMISC